MHFEAVIVFLWTTIHWIFATKYLEVCLSFKVLMGLVPLEKIAREKRRVKRILVWANAVFYTYTVVLTGMMYYYLFEVANLMRFYLYPVCFLTSILVFTYSVIGLR